METYFHAKRRLFEMLPPDAPGVINLDDPRGASLVDVCRTPGHVRTRPGPQTSRPVRSSITLSGLAFDIGTPRGTVQIESTLVGRPNVSNILAAAATAMAMDFRSTRSPQGCERCRACRDASRWFPPPTTKSPSWSTTRTPTMRCAICSRRRVRSPPQAAGDGLRLRRRSRSHQAPADGDGGGAFERRRGDHVRQPAQRRTAAHHRGDQARHPRGQPVGAARPTSARSSIAAKRSSARSNRASPATSCSSPARDTRSTSRSAIACCRSTTARWRAAALARRRRAAEPRRADERAHPLVLTAATIARATGGQRACPGSPTTRDRRLLDRLAHAAAGRSVLRDRRRARRPRLRRRGDRTGRRRRRGATRRRP